MLNSLILFVLFIPPAITASPDYCLNILQIPLHYEQQNPEWLEWVLNFVKNLEAKASTFEACVISPSFRKKKGSCDLAKFHFARAMTQVSKYPEVDQYREFLKNLMDFDQVAVGDNRDCFFRLRGGNAGSIFSPGERGSLQQNSSPWVRFEMSPPIRAKLSGSGEANLYVPVRYDVVSETKVKAEATGVFIRQELGFVRGSVVDLEVGDADL